MKMANYTFTPNDEARFWAKVNKSGSCWNWTAYTNKSGYGQFKLGGMNPVAHRVAWMMTNGEIPDGLILDHRCHNAACVNPEHLRIATHKQNHENLPGPYANNTTGVLGVTLYKRTGKYKAEVKHWGKRYHVGYFHTVAEAEVAVIAKRNELFTHNDLDRVAA